MKERDNQRKLHNLLERRWGSMEIEERHQEQLFFTHYALGNRLKNFESGFFLDYYQNQNPLVSYFSWKKVKIIAENVKRNHEVRKAAILDVGCGCGFFFKEIGEGENHYGVDLSRIFLKGAKANAPWVHFTRHNAKHLPFPDDHFDAVICNDVLEHAFFPEKIIQEIDRVAKPGKNRIFISIPNEFNCRIGRIIAMRFPVNWPFHINALNPRVLKENINRNLSSTFSTPFNHVPWLFTLEQIFIF